GRPSRVVLIPRRWDQAFRATNLLGDGGYQARHSRESAKQPLKPSRRECRIAPALPVVTAACFSICRRAMGAASIRHSLRPPLLSRVMFGKTRADHAAGVLMRAHIAIETSHASTTFCHERPRLQFLQRII